MLLGQDRAGKTSLKKSLLGIPFNPEEESTVGVEVDPSKFEVDVDQVKNWQRTQQKKLDVCEFANDIARIIAKDLTETETDQRNVDDMNAVLQQVIGFLSGSLFRFHSSTFTTGRGRGYLPTLTVLKSRQHMMTRWRQNCVMIFDQPSSLIFRFFFLTMSETLMNLREPGSSKILQIVLT